MPNWQTKRGAAKRAGYRSGLEDSVATKLKELGIDFQYEPKEGRISYTVPASNHSYTPDFYVTTKSGKTIVIETKGLWSAEDREKHRLIKEQHPDLDLRFVFTRSKAKINKNSKTTYADICEGRGRGPFKGVTWLYADKRIPDEWLQE
jgi:predicted nuclease of restriction endonuclease-like RecB superfamily